MNQNKEPQRNHSFATLIRKAGYTQKQFADTLELKPQTVNGWIQGKYKPTPFNMAKMATVLHVDFDELNNIFFGGN